MSPKSLLTPSAGDKTKRKFSKTPKNKTKKKHIRNLQQTLNKQKAKINNKMQMQTKMCN